MPPSNLEEQLQKHLTDAHSIEQQALVQMKIAPRIAGDDRIAEAFSVHLAETEEHERLIRSELERHDAKPSKIKDLAGDVTGFGFGVFAAVMPSTPGKLVAHGFSYEHMEQAAYILLAGVAERAGDEETAATAKKIGAQERQMAERIAGMFDIAVEVSLRSVEPEALPSELDSYLGDAHALEQQSIQLLSKGQKIVGSDEVSEAFREHLAQSEEHRRLIEERLKARDASPSRIKDAALQMGALNLGAFFGVQPDTPAKLAAFAYAFEHLEIASYELLRRVAQRASDSETERVADQILTEERVTAGRLRSMFDEALDTTLAARELS